MIAEFNDPSRLNSRHPPPGGGPWRASIDGEDRNLPPPASSGGEEDRFGTSALRSASRFAVPRIERGQGMRASRIAAFMPASAKVAARGKAQPAELRPSGQGAAKA